MSESASRRRAELSEVRPRRAETLAVRSTRVVGIVKLPWLANDGNLAATGR